MSEENKVEQTTEAKSEVSIETLQAEIAKLKDIAKEAFSSRDAVKAKLKEFEDKAEADKNALLAEQGKFKELYEAELNARKSLEEGFRNTKLESALKEALAEAGAVSVPTAMKVIDRSAIKFSENGEVDVESIKEVLKGVKKEHEILFNKPKKPTPDGAPAKQDTGNESTYIEAMRALRARSATPFEFEQLRRRFGKSY